MRRNPVFRFFASLQLALLLLAVLIVASIIGTIYESKLTAEVARAFIYEAWWFNLWLLLLAGNLAGVAFSRLPWKKHHTGFLLTHLGIIILLAGAWIGKTWGIEGSITLFKGNPPTNTLLINQKELRLARENGPAVRLPVPIIHRQPTPESPRRLGTYDGWTVHAVGSSEKLEPVFTPLPVQEGGAPALKLVLRTAMMNQTLERWLWAGSDEQSTYELGLARVRLLRGTAPAVGKKAPSTTPARPATVRLREHIFAFALMPEQQVGKVQEGGATGFQVRLDATGPTPVIRLQRDGRQWTFTPAAADKAQEWAVSGTPFRLKFLNYWPDFRLQDGKPVSVSVEPNNPAILVELAGTGAPAAAPAATDPHAAATPATTAASGDASPNRLDLFVDDQGTLTYHLFSRKQGESRGVLRPEEPLPTGWADWTATAAAFVPRAEEDATFRPLPEDAPTGPGVVPGIRVRFKKDTQSFEEWVPQGWSIQAATPQGPVFLRYGFRTAALPFTLELVDFEVERYPGSTNPSEFRSTLRATMADGTSATGSCSMNQPMNFPHAWWRSWTGLTYKLSQASWNPENLGQSSIQILRDPGWFCKWLGSLILCIGIFCLFYMRPVKGDLKP